MTQHGYWYALLRDHRGKPSAGRLIHVVGGLTLAAATLALSCAALLGHTDTGNALLAVTGPLAALAGFGFVGGKHNEAKAPHAPD